MLPIWHLVRHIYSKWIYTTFYAPCFVSKNLSSRNERKGPVSGALANRLGFRLTMIIGAAFGCTGIGMCYFLNNFVAHMCCYGILAGIGGSMVYMTSIAAPGFWFEEKRALAAGISSSTSGLAAIIVPLIATVVEEHFNWRLVIVIPAGMYFVLFFLAFLIRKAPAAFVQAEKQTKPIGKLKKEDIFSSHSVVSLLGGGAHSHRKLLQISQHTGMRANRVREFPYPLEGRKCSRCRRVGTYVERPMYKKDVFYHGSVHRIRERHKLLPGQYTVSVAKLPTLKDVRQEVECKCACPEAITRGMRTLFNFGVCSNKAFLMIFFATFFFYSGIYIPFLYLKRISLENGLKDDYANVLTPLFGAGIVVSRCTIGIILLVFPRLGCLNVTIASFVISSLFSYLVTLYFQAIYQIVINIVYGYITGLFLPLRSVMLIDYVGLEKLTSAMGFIFTIQGLGCFVGIPIAEILMSVFDDTRWALYHAAVVFAIALFFLSFVYLYPIHHPESILR
ncbi:monocarboxylate transporter 14-like isoform X2 [Rhodnius prolixus]|uniref:monocarboxylate transporter 14-like isoform X2 n=1 Tax=Rhodnius prolixus TaxID=13249 RepID=UPI003D18C696